MSQHVLMPSRAFQVTAGDLQIGAEHASASPKHSAICTEKPVRIFCQMKQHNFSTNSIEREERCPFVAKTSENFPPNGTVHFP